MSELAKIRRSKGFSQRGLAEVASVSPSSVYEIETGRRKANPSTLRKLADALGVEVVDLLEEEERPKGDAPLSFSRWLEERCGHSYLAMTEEELIELLTNAAGDEAEKISRAVQAEYMLTLKTRDLPTEERLLARGHHLEATDKWFSVLVASGRAEHVTDEFERSVKEALEAAADEATA